MLINKTRSRCLHWLSVWVFLTLVSCNKDGNNNCETTEFFNNGDYVFQYSCEGSNIRFYLDIPADTTLNQKAVYPDRDIFRLYVDVNRNGELDPGLDFIVSPDTENRTCIAALTSQTSTQGCTYYDDVNDTYIWAESENSMVKHVGFFITVPKELLSNGGSGTNVVIHLYDAQNGWQYFPSGSELFKDTYEIFW